MASTTRNAPKKSKQKPKAPAAKGKKKNRAKGAKKARFTAKTADLHELYQYSVQSPEEDVAFLRRVYHKVRKKHAKHFREDFCGTALNSSEWVKKGPEFTAEGFDISAETIAWGIERNFEPLGDAASRCRLHVKDVREMSHKRPDVRAAQNFSYFCFKTREEQLAYFRSAKEDLAPDGVFVLDIYGGPDSMNEMEEVRDIEEGFTYVWDQHQYWPATGDYKAYIHFRFKDGTELKRAFKYEWRLWGLLEIRDLLQEAGFKTVDQYWEGTDDDGESGNGVFSKSKRGENCEAWVTYLVAYD